MKYLNYLGSMLEKFFVLLILGMAGVAMLMPQPFITALKVRLFNQSLVVVCLGLIMFVMGLTMKKEDFKVVLKRPKDVFIGCLAQFAIMPLVAYGLSVLFKLPPELAVGLVLLGTCPGGTASNVMTYLAKGDVALSVGMTAVSTILAPVLTPALTYFLAGQWVEINAMTMVLSIFKIVIAPIFLGISIHYLFDRAVQKLKKVLVIVPIVSIIFIMGMLVAANKQNLLNASFMLIAAVAVHNWIGFALGYVVGHFTKMNKNKKKALSLEVGLQNSGLAAGLSAQISSPLAVLPAVIATVVHQISGSLLANLFGRGTFSKFNRNFGLKKAI